jgi:5,10-methylene-tetrahydrofolate dehydrogenase/methenyl tetrahydrofolate cyclohydrolase
MQLEVDKKKEAAVERKDKFNQEIARAELRKQEEAKKRAQTVHVKIGKPDMFRSKKKIIKKEVVVVKVDEETADKQKYLGAVEEEA